MRDAVSAGLDSALPWKYGYVQTTAGWSSVLGAQLRAEGVLRLTPWLGTFGFADWRPGREVAVGAGLRAAF